MFELKSFHRKIEENKLALKMSSCPLWIAPVLIQLGVAIECACDFYYADTIYVDTCRGSINYSKCPYNREKPTRHSIT